MRNPRTTEVLNSLRIGVGGIAALLFVTAAAAGSPLDVVPRSLGPTTSQVLSIATNEAPGTILISTEARTLEVVISARRVIRYTVGVARDGFSWSGTVRVGRKAEWPTWRPPLEMRRRDPSLPELMPGGPYNPLGARAIYLFKGDTDTLYRIHGTNETGSIGGFVSSGCFRMTNADVIDLYSRVAVDAKVIVR